MLLLHTGCLASAQPWDQQRVQLQMANTHFGRLWLFVVPRIIKLASLTMQQGLLKCIFCLNPAMVR